MPPEDRTHSQNALPLLTVLDITTSHPLMASKDAALEENAELFAEETETEDDNVSDTDVTRVQAGVAQNTRRNRNGQQASINPMATQGAGSLGLHPEELRHTLIVRGILQSIKRGTLYRRRVGRPQSKTFDPPRNPATSYEQPPPPRMPSPPVPRHDRFDVYNALLSHHEIMWHVASHMYVDQMMSLYSICKDFHRLVNRKFASTMLANARNRAPESARVFHWKCYRDTCIYDPAANQNQIARAREQKTQMRDIPGFQWLSMVTFREESVDSVLFELAEAGHRLPRRASMVLKKIWFLMDIPDNARRIGLIHNPKYWNDTDLYVASMFFMKLDMRFCDPMDSKATPFIRKMMLAQKSLSTLDRVLMRVELTHMEDVVMMFMEWKGQLPPVFQQQMLPTRAGFSDIFGVPRPKIGSLGCEDWTRGNKPLLRPDELVMREAIKRDLRLERWYLDMMLWGYIDDRTGKDVWPPSTELAEKMAMAKLKEKGLDGVEEETGFLSRSSKGMGKAKMADGPGEGPDPRTLSKETFERLGALIEAGAENVVMEE